MPEPFIVLLVLSIVLGVITVLGHLLWLFFAWIVVGNRRCDRCQTRLSRQVAVCSTCGWAVRRELREALDADIAATARQLDRLLRASRISQDTHRSLIETLRAEQLSLRTPATQPAPPPVPGVAPATTATAPVSTIRPTLTGAVTTPSHVPTEEPIELQPFALSPAEVPTPAPPPRRFPSLGQPAAPPPPPRKPFAQVLAAFMLEKNIRWGELVGGLLIVGCSIALVFSLWSQIEQIAIVKFFLFTGVTAALFGVGLYTEHRWKLPMTSRGVLIIATLLVPLNFLAIVAFSRDRSALDPLVVGSEALAATLFFWLIWLASRVIARDWAWLMPFGVLVPSLAQLLFRRVPAVDASTLALYLVGAVPLASYLATSSVVIRRARRWPAIGESQLGVLFTSLGVVAFASVLAFGLLVRSTERVVATLHDLAPLVSLFGAPLLAGGLLVWQRVTDRELSGARMAGTSVGVFGVLLMLAGIVLAWPNPSTMLPVALVDFAVLTLVAIWFHVPAAHLLAAPCLVLAYVIGFHLLQPADHPHRIGWDADAAVMIRSLASATTGVALLPMSLLLAALSGGLRRFGRAADGLFYSMVAAGVAALGLALATYFGFGVAGDPYGVTYIYAIYAAVAFTGAVMTHHRFATFAGSALTLAALLQAFAYRFAASASSERWLLALLAHGSVMAAGCVVIRFSGARTEDAGRTNSPSQWRSGVGQPLALSGIISSFIAVPLWLMVAADETTRVLAGYTLWLAALWLLLAYMVVRAALFGLGQAALALSAVIGVVAVLEDRQWFDAAARPLLDPWTIEAEVIALAALGLMWTLVRLGVRSNRSDSVGVIPDEVASWRRTVWALLDPPWPAPDRLITAATLIGFVGLAWYAVLPGLAGELSSVEDPTPASFDEFFVFQPREHLLDQGVWFALAALAVALVASLWEQVRAERIWGLLLLASAACPLVAANWELELASASALRWSCAAYFFAASLIIWSRTPLRQLASRIGWQRVQGPIARDARSLVLTLGAMPVVALTVYVALMTLSGEQLLRPVAESFFSRIGDMLSYVVPMGAVSIVLAGHAVRERSAAYALGSSSILNVTVTLGYLLYVVTAGERVGELELIRLAQFNAMASAAFALAWLGYRRYLVARDAAHMANRVGRSLLSVQVSIAVLAEFAVIAFALWMLFVSPSNLPAWLPIAGDWIGWLAFGLVVAAVLIARVTRVGFASLGTIVGALLGLGSLLAFTTSIWDSSRSPVVGVGGEWLAYHALLLGWVAAAWLTWVLGAFVGGAGRPVEQSASVPPDPARDRAVSLWTMAVLGLVVLLSLRASAWDPQRPWWSAGALVAMSGLAVALTRWSLRGSFLYVAGGLFNLAASIWWVSLWWSNRDSAPLDFVFVNVIALAFPAVAWLILDLQVLRRGRIERSRLRPFHQVAAVLSLVGVAFVPAIGLLSDLNARPLSASLSLTVVSLAAVVCLLAFCLWDRTARFAVASLYLLGLVAAVAAVDQLDLSPDWIVWTLVMLVAAYSVATSYLWTRREQLAAWARACGIDRQVAAEGPRWLVVASVVVATGVLSLAFLVTLRFDEFGLRLAAGKAAAAQGLAVGLLAHGVRRALLQRVALVFAAIGAVAWSWAWLEPGAAGNILHRAVMILTVTAGLGAVYGMGLVKLVRRENEWTRAARDLMIPLLGAATCSLVFVLASELVQWRRGGVEMHPVAIAVVALTLLGLSLVALAAALLPGRDPLNLSERGRMAYVYAAEAMVAILFAHIRLSMPWLFSGWFTQYWPLVVVFLGFVGAGLSEVFRRQGRLVLATPLERTGALLPILPVLTLWMLPTRLPYFFFVAMAALYAGLSIARKSFGFGVLAAIAANGGLWYFLHHQEGYGLLEHPQLWLVPVAVSVLVGAYLNRERLSEKQMTGLRYACLTVIYVSSTADIFLNGVREAPWLPLVLASLSVAGIAAGIALRVRAFLFLGTSFLVLSLLAMILSAHLNLGWTWLWWASGIALGAAIIAIFAVFEKKRSEVLQLVDGLKQWET